MELVIPRIGEASFVLVVFPSQEAPMGGVCHKSVTRTNLLPHKQWWLQTNFGAGKALTEADWWGWRRGLIALINLKSGLLLRLQVWSFHITGLSRALLAGTQQAPRTQPADVLAWDSGISFVFAYTVLALWSPFDSPYSILRATYMTFLPVKLSPSQAAGNFVWGKATDPKNFSYHVEFGLLHHDSYRNSVTYCFWRK